MRSIRLFIVFLSFLPLSIHAQEVVTVAGVVESPGYLDGPALQSLFNNPHGVAVDQQGNLYIADRYGHRIRKLSVEGMVSTIAGSGTPGRLDGRGINASFNEPWGICVTPDGQRIYVADTRNNLIRAIDSEGLVTTLAGSGNYGTSDGFRQGATFGNPTGIEAAADGTLYIADHLTHIIRKIDPSGFVTTLAGAPYLPGAADGPGSSARFYRPYGLTLDGDGNIIVADEWNHLIRKITPDGVVSTLAGNGQTGSEDGKALQASFNYPWDVAVDGEGQIFIADGYNNVIRQLDLLTRPTDPEVSTYAGGVGELGSTDGNGSEARFSGATSIAYASDEDALFVGDAYNHLIRKIVKPSQNEVILQVRSGKSIFCRDALIEFEALPADGDRYHFYVDDQLAKSGAQPQFSTNILTDGIHRIRVVVEKGGNNFTSNDLNITVTSVAKPSITIVGDTSFFEGDSVLLISSNAHSYLWSNRSTIQRLSVFESGTYFVQVFDVNGCTNISDPVMVSVTPLSDDPEIVSAGGDTVFCFGETGVLSSSYASNNQWFKDGWPIEGATDSTLMVSESGVYQVQFTDDNGFKLQSNELSLTFLPQLVDDFQASAIELSTDDPVASFAAQTNWEVDYLWDFGDPGSGSFNQSNQSHPSHRFSQPGTYSVTLMVTTEEGCSQTMEKAEYLHIREEAKSHSDLFIPSAFTPNGDGVNDIFIVRGENIAKVTMYICNQWGELVFQSRSETEGWNGRMNGKRVQNGNYTYLAKIEFNNGDQHQLSGFVTVLN